MPDTDNAAQTEADYAFRLAQHLTTHDLIVYPSRREPKFPIRRALTIAEANGHAYYLFGKGEHLVEDALQTCWTRLPGVLIAEAALSYQRLITAFTTVLAWNNWEAGRDIIDDIQWRARERKMQADEDKALEAWTAAGLTRCAAPPPPDRVHQLRPENEVHSG